MLALAVSGLAPAAAANASAVVYVDPSWSLAMPGERVGAGRFAGTNAFSTIQAAVDAAAPGGTVNIGPGSYVEQVVIDGKNLILAGAGAGTTTIVSPAVLPVSFTSGTFTNRPVLLCRNAASIEVTGLTVDGDGQGNANVRFVGIAYVNAGGRVAGVDIVRVRNTPLDNVQHGFGLYCTNSGGGPYTLECDGVIVSDFQKNGMLLNGAGMTVDVHDSDVTGAGDVSVIAQNGIQLGSGAGGSIRDCALANLRYTPAIAVSGAILVFQPGAPVHLSGFTGAHAFSNVQAPIRWYDGNGSIDGVEVTGPVIETQDFGAITISNFSGASGPLAAAPDGFPPSAPVVEAVPGADAYAVQRAMAAIAVNVSHLCLTGGDTPGTTGLYVYSTGGPLTVNVTGALLHDWQYGLRAVGLATMVHVDDSSIASNTTAGVDNQGSGNVVNAESIWWGDASGPSGAGPGTGDAILGANVDFTPWLVNGTNAATGCGFAAAPEQVAATALDPCLSTATLCVTVDVSIARTTMTGVRGFSVPVQLSPNLLLCSGASSITEGTYLSAAGTTLFQVIDQGGGAYTVDGVILGLPCGATAPSGTLFSLEIAKAPEPDGPATVTIGTPVLRDCVNGPIPAAAGPAASITIDTAGPAAIADMSATQVRTGNDTDGTTKILLDFTPPGDAVSVEVYRAGFGNYPEYDDAPGSGMAPAAPVYPPGPPWTLTAITAGGQSDEVAQRDFFYYVAFTKDACGNVSAVSNRTNGTLNYHLGDVSNGITAGQGNNRVLVEDISLLGIHYPALLGAGDPFGYLDVGPTTDHSVNALPTTDNRVDFEDLIVFALNYSIVAAPAAAVPAEAADRNTLSLGIPVLPAVGETFDVPLTFTGRGDVLGMSLTLTWNASVAEPVATSAGALLGRQSRGAVALPAGPGALDLALLGQGSGIVGTGEIARATFRVLSPGDPRIGFGRVDARDGANRAVPLDGGTGVMPAPAPPARTAFSVVSPNPSPGGTRIEFTLARPGAVGLTVFDLSGRRVRTLLDEPREAGVHRVGWNGRDERGQPVPAGLYVLRLEAAGTSATRRVAIVR